MWAFYDLQHSSNFIAVTVGIIRSGVNPKYLARQSVNALLRAWAPSRRGVCGLYLGAVNAVGSVRERIQLPGHLYDSNTVIIRFVLNTAHNELKRSLHWTQTGIAQNTKHGSAPCLLQGTCGLS